MWDEAGLLQHPRDPLEQRPAFCEREARAAQPCRKLHGRARLLAAGQGLLRRGLAAGQAGATEPFELFDELLLDAPVDAERAADLAA